MDSKKSRSQAAACLLVADALGSKQANESSTNKTRLKRRVEMMKKNCDLQQSTSSIISFTRLLLMALLSSTIVFLVDAFHSTGHQIVLLDSPKSQSFMAANINGSNFSASLFSPAAKQSASQQIQATFSTPNQAINITHVTYDPINNVVYVGATNTLYQLNGSDLSLQHEQSTGPVLDHPNCGITECQGYEDLMKPTPNVNKVLVIDYQHQKLLSCGSTKQGACRRYQLNNISQKDDLTLLAVAANDDNSSTYAFIAPARYNDDQSLSAGTSASVAQQQQQQVLYVATTYTKVGQSRDMVPAIGSRILDDGPNLLKLYENSMFDTAHIAISSHLRDYFLVNYLYGFASSNYVYFVTLQKKATSRDYEEMGYHTRLARVCISDPSFNSYTEVDLKCMPNKRRSSLPQGSKANQQQLPKEYPLLQDAILVDGGSLLLQSLAQGDQSSGSPSTGFFNFNNPSSSPSTADEGKVLLGVFSSARDHTHHAGDHSALCAFSLAHIEELFNDNIHNCYTGKMQSRNMEYIAGNVQECRKSGQGGNVVNYCHDTLKINGTLPITSEASIQYFNTTLSAITATSHINGDNLHTSDQLTNSEFSSFNVSESAQQSLNGKFYASSSQTTGSNNNPSRNGGQSRLHTVVFMGTSNGHIKKVLLDNATNGIEFEDLKVDSNPIIGDLHVHASGQHLIAATPYKVMRLPVQNCQRHANCRECSQSRDPHCGWCSLKRSCTTRGECISAEQQQQPQQQQQQQQQRQQLKWISSESQAKCIDLQSIVPDKLPITSTGKLDLYIDRLPRLPKEHSYRCVFDGSEQTIGQMAHFGLSCPLPKLMHRPKIEPGRDHAIVDLAVRSSETNTDFLNGRFTFFECQLHTTCKDCLTTNWGCNWCLNENICLFNTSKCEKSQGQRLASSQQPKPSGAPLITISGGSNQRLSLQSAAGGAQLAAPSSGRLSGNTIGQVSQCPTFDVGHKQDILIANGSERELAIRVKNMPQIKGNVQCIVEIENDKLQLKARIEDERVICQNSTYSYSADVGLLLGQLVVTYSENSILIDRTNFTLYKCHLLGAYLNRPDCSLCQRIDPRFQCQWCASGCRHKADCREPAEVACPAPRIDLVHPLAGPTAGGTRLTIEGSNLGQSFEEIANRVMVGNAPCKPIEEEYKPSNKIVCLTSPLVSLVSRSNPVNRQPEIVFADLMVGNRAGYSMGPGKFQFRQVQLRDHQPRYGPQSGGTRLTLTGANLNVGSQVQVFLDDLPCQVELATLTSEQLHCRTSPSRQANRWIRRLKLVIDDAQIVREDEEIFFYAQDPTITRITPLRSYLSGGRPINVLGTNLTVVQAPRLAIMDQNGRLLNESLCLLQDESRMQCPSPAINGQLFDLEWAEQHLARYETNTGPSTSTGSSATILHEDSLRFRLSLIMDDVWRLRDLQTSAPQLSTEIIYSSDPKLYPFASPQFRLAHEAHEAANLQTGHQHQEPAVASYQLDPDTYLLLPGEPTLVLHGDNLRLAVSEYEITVTVGQSLCNLTHLGHKSLVCLMPIDHLAAPTDEEGHPTQRGLPLVAVRIGFNLRFELGFVQYHPTLVEQIVQLAVNSSMGPLAGEVSGQFMRPPPSYLPRESGDGLLRRFGQLLASLLVTLLYAALGVVIVALLYSGAGSLRRRSFKRHEYRRMQSQLSSLEKSVRGECRLAALALQSDLAELIRQLELTGAPLLSAKSYVMKVFFPGINNHPLAARSTSDTTNRSQLPGCTNQQQANVPLSSSFISAPDLPMDHFRRLIMCKPFLVAFINTLEAQPNFTIRDKVNVASLVMVVLMERLDYATDVMRTLLLQLVERAVARSRRSMMARSLRAGAGRQAFGRSLSRRASNMLNSLGGQATGQTCQTRLAKAVGGSASSLMASTQVAAQMLLSRVGAGQSIGQQSGKPSDYLSGGLQQGESDFYAQVPSQFPAATLGHSHCMSTTTFRQGNTLGRPLNTMRPNNTRRRSEDLLSSVSWTDDAQLMLRKTDSVVEKMLTNWLALNMYGSFHGPVGRSLYLAFEALRCQLERGPIDQISGDAYYSISETKLLREPSVRFETVNLYVLVDGGLLQSYQSPVTSQTNNLLLDSSLNGQPIYEDSINRPSQSMTLALRALDCDTISQVKAKVLASLYKTAPTSSRLTIEQVELGIHQQHLQTYATSLQQQLQLTGGLVLRDEDRSTTSASNGTRRLNTLRHYGITDQAILSLRLSPTQTNGSSTLSDILTDDHYANPYTEIQYVTRPEDSGLQRQVTVSSQQPVATKSQQQRSWHLIGQPDRHCSLNNQQLEPRSLGSSPTSQSPSMMLLGHEHLAQQAHQSSGAQYYHPSSSSSSSTGNQMETNSTSANSSAMNVTNLLMRARNEQPIYCQIGNSSAAIHQATTGNSCYCQTPANRQVIGERQLGHEEQIYLARMLTSKGTLQQYIDELFGTILNIRSRDHFGQTLCAETLSRQRESTSSCPPAVKWLFDLLDEAAEANGVTDPDVLHAWKSNAFLLRFWVNLIKNPNYALDVTKSNTMDANLSVLAQTLMEACAVEPSAGKTSNGSSKLLFTKDMPRYRQMVKRFYQDVASARPVSDHEMAAQMSQLSEANAGQFDTNLALKELCVYAVNYGVELMASLNQDAACQQLELSQQLEQCFRSFTIYEAYR